MKLQSIVFSCILGPALLASNGVAFGQAISANFPTKPIRVIVPFPPGGAADLLPRTISEKLVTSLGHPLIVDNKPGGGSTIGVAQGARAPADGYTLTLVTNGFTVNASLFEQLPYNTTKDFTPVVRLASSPHTLVINPSTQAKTVKELTEVARQKSGGLTFASVGAGTISHLEGEMLKKLSNVQLSHVPYKGLAPAITDLIGGHVDLLFAAVPDAAPQLEAGKLRALAITSPKRSKLLPNLPTMTEAGYAGFEFEAWFGLIAPAGTPPAVVQKLNAEINRVLQQPDVSKDLLSRGLEPAGGSSAEFGVFMEQEIQKYGRLVREGGIKAN